LALLEQHSTRKAPAVNDPKLPDRSELDMVRANPDSFGRMGAIVTSAAELEGFNFSDVGMVGTTGWLVVVFPRTYFRFG